jgi:hypothetical protein
MTSILPSSDATILKPMVGKHGVLQVKAIEQLDTYGLFYTDGSYDSVIAMHSNGYSCHCLAKRIMEVWDGKHPASVAIAQYQFINSCGGMTKNDATMEYIINKSDEE